MAKPNDMPEFHSVKVSLTENIPATITRLPPTANACNATPLRNKGGCGHV
ncbi:hypothetical protein [Thalassomonas sp. RHCl1]|nr:hypothetical protein [Thalassomonas sp. RHCl1]